MRATALAARQMAHRSMSSNTTMLSGDFTASSNTCAGKEGPESDPTRNPLTYAACRFVQ